jgi:hypothetical protein
MSLKIFSDIFWADGFARGVIYDIGRNNYHIVPNKIIEFLNRTEKNDFIVSKNMKNEKYSNFKIIDFLLKNDFVFQTNNPEWFPRMSSEYACPSLISNLIWDYNEKFMNILISIINNLNIKSLVLRILEKKSTDEISTILNNFSESTLTSIELNIIHNQTLNFRLVQDMAVRNQRLFTVISFKAPLDKVEYLDKQKTHLYIQSTSEILYNSELSLVNPFTFRVNQRLFMESQNHHSYFYKKAYIDIDGYIHNSPESLNYSLSLSDDSSLNKLILLLDSDEFNQLFTIKKSYSNGITFLFSFNSNFFKYIALRTSILKVTLSFVFNTFKLS